VVESSAITCSGEETELLYSHQSLAEMVAFEHRNLRLLVSKIGCVA